MFYSLLIKPQILLYSSCLLLAACGSRLNVDPDQFQDRLYGMLMGSAVADALAGPHEGRPTDVSQQFLEGGGWIDQFDTSYNRWYQSHWNVFELGAVPGTYTDDSRLRLFAAETMLDYGKAEPFPRRYLANGIFDRYRYSRIRYTDLDKDSLKEHFLEMWFWWELTKLATSVVIPDPPLHTPPVRREDLLDEKGERTGYWKLANQEALPVESDLKLEWHDGSYQEGKEWPMGMISLLPLAAYFPGQPEKAFGEVLRIDFMDIGNAPLYPAFFSALIADGLGGRSWSKVRADLLKDGVQAYACASGKLDVHILEPQVRQALELSKRFRERSDYPSRRNVIAFVKTLHEAFAIGMDYDMCSCEEMLTVPLALADYSMGLGLQQAIEYGVNYGRDNDTVASFVATLVGAYRGIDDVRQDWIQLVQERNPDVNIFELSVELSSMMTR